MAVRIGHASINEFGKIVGGIAGDQNKKEVCITNWYNKPWYAMLRPTNSTIAEKSAKACETGCKNDFIGYDQNARNTLHNEARKCAYDLTKIAVPCSTDCSAFMTVCAISGGVTALEYNGNAPTTSTMIKAFTDTGKYKIYIDDKYLSSDKYLKRGDILVTPGSHTVMVLDDGGGQAVVHPKVVDLSRYNNITSYTNLKAAGVNYGVVKIIDKERNIEPFYERHYNGLKNAGINVLCVYNYSYATNVEEAKKDAMAVVKALGGRKIPVALDVENDCQKNMGLLLIDIIRSYQRVIENAGLSFILYTGMYFYNTFIKPFEKYLGSQQVWIARYPSSEKMLITDNPDESKKPNIPGVFMWQYSPNVVIPEVCATPLDCSLLYSAIIKNNKVAKMGFVNEDVNSLRIRSAPNKEGDELGFLTRGDKIWIYAESEGWYKIDKDESRWVSGKYIHV